MIEKNLTLWNEPEKEFLPAKLSNPSEIADYARQLSARERNQIIQNFQNQHYEIAVSYVWSKAMSALKRELSTLGVKFLGEMLNKPDLTDDDDVYSAVTDREAIRLAEELGIVSPTEAMRLRHAQELITHFSQLDASAIDDQSIEMDVNEATQALKTCIKNILGKPKIEVATNFVEFRDSLISTTLKESDRRIKTLLHSPYFFHKLTVSILLSSIKKNIGARLEHSLANLNLIIPLLWSSLRDTEKWQIGHSYAEVHASGRSSIVSGLRTALLKVQGFDYVPENLRSDTFVKAAESLIAAHEGINNFHNEEAPIKVLFKLGSTIPAPAFSICTSAILSVRLGNFYGHSWSAVPVAVQLLDNFTQDRWQYYLNQCLPGDIRILEKLYNDNPLKNWIELVKKYDLHKINITKNKDISLLTSDSFQENTKKIKSHIDKLRKAYYGQQIKRT